MDWMDGWMEGWMEGWKIRTDETVYVVAMRYDAMCNVYIWCAQKLTQKSDEFIHQTETDLAACVGSSMRCPMMKEKEERAEAKLNGCRYQTQLKCSQT